MTSTATTPQAKCNASYTRKVKGGAVKTYKCEKPKGHPGTTEKPLHGRVVARKDISITSGDLDTFEAVPDTEYVPLVTRDRSDDQKKVDGHVKQAHEDWVNAGKPKDAKDSPRSRYLIKPVDEEGYRTLLRRAGDFHNVRVQVGQPTPHESGRLSLQFRVTDRTEKASTTPAQAPAQS